MHLECIHAYVIYQFYQRQKEKVVPTLYVTTKFVLKGGPGNWKAYSSEQKQEIKEGLLRLTTFGGNEFSISLIDADSSSSRMRVCRENFGPDGAFKIDFDESTGKYQIEFDGAIKLPVTRDVEAAVDALPKKEPTTIWITGHSVYSSGMVLAPSPTSAPCTVKKSKPKDIAF